MAETSAITFLWRLGQVLFREADEFAGRQGWQIQTGLLGLTRVYRHSAFDRLACCSEYCGSGLSEDAGCGRCAGTGRVTLGNPAPDEPGWPT